MKALISPNESRETGYRVAQVVENSFDVAAPLFWVECNNDVAQDLYWFDPTDNVIKLIPIEEVSDAIDNGTPPEIQTGVV